MYRLLRVRGRAPLQGAWASLNLQTCFKCNICRGTTPLPFLQLRFLSSTLSNTMLNSVGKRKFKKKSKKYAELLEVKDSETNNRKAAVQKLSSAQLSILVNQPDITLDKLHKIDKKYLQRKSKSNQSVIKNFSSRSTTVDSNPSSSQADFHKFSGTCDADLLHEDSEFLVEDLKDSGIMDESVIIKSVSLINDSPETSENVNFESSLVSDKSEELNHSEVSEDKELSARQALIHQQEMKQFNRSILSFINVCVNSNAAFNKKYLFRWMPNSKYPSKLYVNDVSVYNAYIEKLASEGDLSSILEILERLRSMEIKLNVHTYAHIFNCIGHMEGNDSSKLEILKQITEEMNNDHISLNDIITKSTFVHDQRLFVENMVKLLDKDFQPVYEVSNMAYDCRLLDKLSKENAMPSSTVESLLNLNDLEDRLKKQMKMEIDGQVIVQNIAKENTSTQNFWRNKLTHLESKWEKQALHAFKRNLEILKRKESFERKKIPLHPYLSLSRLRPGDYIRILMKEVRKIGMGSEMYSIPYNSLCRNLGAQVFKMYEAKTKESNGVNDKTSEVYMQYCDWFLKRDDKLNPREKWTTLEHEANKSGVTLNAEVPAWQSNIHWNVGNFLYKIILEDLQIDSSYIYKKKEGQPQEHKVQRAFHIIPRHNGVKIILEIKPLHMVSQLYKDSNPETLIFDTTLVPSVCPPRPWTSIRYGGYVVTKTDIVRVTDMGNQQWDRLVQAPPQKLYPALDSLNQLGSIPWTVNTSVLDIAIKVFRSKGSVELNMPQPPSVLSLPGVPENANPEEKTKIIRERAKINRKKQDMYSLWCDALYRLSLANHFRDDLFWLPHNMDFRGRVYPVPPHLNHLGSDLARSILVFALKKPLGPNGLDWLKLHCINLTGFKKRDPIRDRLKFANENMDKILDSADNPLTGEKWWATSDEPWQTLATCIEIAAALRSPNPEEFMSGFPIHQDGSCNGLQHYAALGRDQIGAVSVNLYPSDVPQDVYSNVAAMVDECRQNDANDPDSRSHEIAKVLDGFVKRKVIKQTVMTTVYGVTRYGAKLQIARQLKDLEDFPKKNKIIDEASVYLMKKTFETLRTMFKSAREIQDWFTLCSHLICVTRGDNMEWVTPLGLPVIQPYSKINWAQLKKNKGTSPIITPDIYKKPDVRKQKNAFAPNYVHSLDSSHMMLTSIHTEHAGITYVSVHDCYWTHSCDVEIMNKICREQFVALHSEPILEDLSKFLVDKFAFPECEFKDEDADINIKDKKIGPEALKKQLNATLRKVPKQGDFDLDGVLSSTYFFS